MNFSDSSKSSDNSSQYHGKMGSKSHWIHKTTLESPPSTISSGSKFKPIDDHSGQSTSPLIRTGNNTRGRLAQWDSHLNMQQLVKNRTKLKTPNSDSDSIEAYAKACRTKFDRKCAKSQNTNYHQGKGHHRPVASAVATTTTTTTTTKALIKTISDRDQPIYTKPYSSDSYSDVRQNSREQSATGHGHHLKGKQRTDMIEADAYTSVTGSGGFLSPNSISIGVAANSTSNTTTHQYDTELCQRSTKISIGLQTTDTLLRMPIIQLKNAIEAVDEPIQETTQPQATATAATMKTTTTTTMRVNKFTVNKQLQVRPESLAYIIVFKDNEASADENANSMAQERGNKLYADSRRQASNGNAEHNSKSSASSSISEEPKQSDKHRLKSVKEQIATDPNRDRDQDRPTRNSSSSSSFENLTLQEYLQAHRPDFYANAEQRRKCLNDLHNLR